MNEPTKEELRLEVAGKRLQLLLYGGEREDDPQFTEWRGDLEASIQEFIDAKVASLLIKES